MALHNRNSLSLDTKAQVVRDHRESCFYCGARGQYVDHIHPLRLGGSNDRSNLTCSCYECNKTKGKWPLRPEALALALAGADGSLGSAKIALASVDTWLDRSEGKTIYLSLNCDDHLTDALEDWAHQNRVKSTGAAIRCMIRFALANGVKLDEEPDLRRKNTRSRELRRREGGVGEGE